MREFTFHILIGTLFSAASLLSHLDSSLSIPVSDFPLIFRFPSPSPARTCYSAQTRAESRTPGPLLRALGRFFPAGGAAAAVGAGMENAWAGEGRSAVAVVTGANKGIGFYIARGLAGEGLTTVLTARDPGLGQEAAKKLQGEGLQGVEFHQLDISDQSSIDSFARWLKDTHGGLDVLVNNAGMAYKGNTFGAEEARKTIDTNYQGTRAVCEALLPLLRPSKAGARIVNVGSSAGKLRIVSPALKTRFTSPTLTTADLDALAEEFVTGIKEGTYKGAGWPESMYGVSKLLENAYTRVLARQVEGRQGGEKVFVNACCPGWCATDMSSWRGRKTAEEGADTPIFLSLLPPEKAGTGQFYADRTIEEF
ncbi:unnamed protein product [Closterium sp. NIES-64]|nr:unnamed protein product [Closterium sp. NIES-64]CAI5960775.1 unnamed protein product [Closterium sp. NIES-64]